MELKEDVSCILLKEKNIVCLINENVVITDWRGPNVIWFVPFRRIALQS
jgi:hypothetical protein